MARNRKTDMAKMDRVETGWKQNAGDDQFAEMTVEEYGLEIEKSRDIRRQIQLLQSQLDDLDSRLDITDKANLGITELVVNGVRGSRKHGPDSPLLGSMGYVRKSERKTGKTNRTKSDK